jgi:hypothetical protein
VTSASFLPQAAGRRVLSLVNSRISNTTSSRPRQRREVTRNFAWDLYFGSLRGRLLVLCTYRVREPELTGRILYIGEGSLGRSADSGCPVHHHLIARKLRQPSCYLHILLPSQLRASRSFFHLLDFGAYNTTPTLYTPCSHSLQSLYCDGLIHGPSS